MTKIFFSGIRPSVVITDQSKTSFLWNLENSWNILPNIEVKDINNYSINKKDKYNLNNDNNDINIYGYYLFNGYNNTNNYRDINLNDSTTSKDISNHILNQNDNNCKFKKFDNIENKDSLLERILLEEDDVFDKNKLQIIPDIIPRFSRNYDPITKLDTLNTKNKNIEDIYDQFIKKPEKDMYNNRFNGINEHSKSRKINNICGYLQRKL